MAKDYNSYSFRNKAVDNIQSRSNTANDPKDKKKKKKRVTRTTNPDGSVTKRRTKRSGDVVVKTIKKPTRVKSTPKPQVTDTRTKEQRKKETDIQNKVNQMVEDKGLITAPTAKEKRKIKRTKRRVDRQVIKASKEKSSKPKTKNKPIRRGFQKGDGGTRRYNNAIRGGTGVGNKKGVTRKRKL